MVTDDQGTLDVNCYGAKHLFTPNLDDLAERGIRFTRAYCHTVCCPSRANLLTGRYSQRCGINFWTQNDRHDAEIGININPGETTIADTLRSAGCKTALMGKWHLGAAEGHGPLEYGFDEFYGHLGGFIENYTHFFLGANDGFHDLWDNETEIFHRDEYYPDLMTKRALQFIEENAADQFFLYLAFNLPHYPEQSDTKFGSHYTGVDDGVRKYGMTVSTVDERIGWVMDKLDELALRENTIVIFMSDNGHSRETRYIATDDHPSGIAKGFYYGAHGAGYTGRFVGNKGSFTEGGIRVPCIISAPGLIAEGDVRHQTIANQDWFPTILEMLDLGRPNGVDFDGKSIKAILDSADAEEVHGELHWQWGSDWAVMDGDWKLIGNNEDAANRMLVNVADEVPEGTNYLMPHAAGGPRPKIAEKLEDSHRNWLDQVKIGYETEAAAENIETAEKNIE